MKPEAALRVFADSALKTAQRELERTGKIAPAFGIQVHEGEELIWFRLTGEMGDLMNSGPAKNQIFAALRADIQKHDAVGAVFITEAWMGRATEKGRALDPHEFLKLGREQKFETLLRRGLVERWECITVTIQTPESATVLHQPFERHERLKLISFGKLEEITVSQDQFRGRQKMFGDLRPENCG